MTLVSLGCAGHVVEPMLGETGGSGGLWGCGVREVEIVSSVAKQECRCPSPFSLECVSMAEAFSLFRGGQLSATNPCQPRTARGSVTDHFLTLTASAGFSVTL